MSQSLKVGETKRFYCCACTTEFEILHEPNYTDKATAESFGGRTKKIKACPFCEDDANLEVM